jgi:N-acetyl-alpha-D-glucosaminyl L-malate synthase BshA
MLRETKEDVHLITTLHGTDITIVGQDPSFFPITKFSIEKSDQVTAVSNYLKDETFRAFGCEGLEIDVIHNFIDPDVYNREKYPPLLKNQFGRSKPILMHVSNFRAVKRVRDVIRIYSEVNRELPCVLVMIGDGPDRPAAEEEARMLGIEESVSFLGKLEQIAPLLAAADLFLLPSQSESFGLSALEALASGVPVVGTNAGGLPEVVREGETGFLCTVGDIPGMAAASLEILQDPKRWAEMSRLASTDARERFSRDAIVTQYESLYRTSLPTNTP